jgi:hypothetical protein
MKRQRYLWLAGILLALLPAAARADVFVLSSGGRIEGELLNPEQAPREIYVVRTPAGGQITLDKALVEQVVVKSPAEIKYEQWLLKMPNTAEGHWIMADWCRQNGLTVQRDFHLEETIARDPNHANARHALGYGNVDGRWVKADDYRISQGEVRYQGAWRLPQEVALDQRQREAELAQKEWRSKLKMWRSWFGKKRSEEGIANIKAIRDPLAAMALGELLEDEQLRQMKLIYIEVLGKLPYSAGGSALIKRSLDDDDDTVRDNCLEQLAECSPVHAVKAFVSVLQQATKATDPKSNVTINRAGVGLTRMNDESAVRSLIEALTTKHKIVIGSGSSSGGMGIGANFSNAGPGGLSMGGKPQVIERDVSNPGVLEALRALTGEDYRYDKDAWKKWYAESHTPPNVNLRRRDD